MGPPGADRKRLKAVVDIFSRLSIACKSRSLYPADHPAAREAVQVLYHVMDDSFTHIPSITVHVGKDSLVYDKWTIGQERESLRRLASRIRSLNIQEITLNAALTQPEAEALVELLVSDPEELDAEGGAETFLLVKGVQNISVVESMARRVDEEAVEERGRTAESVAVEAGAVIEPPESELSVEARDLLELLQNPEDLARSLMRLSVEDGRPLSWEELADSIFQFLKEASSLVQLRYPDKAQRYYRSIAEALLFLETDLRNTLLLRQLIPRIQEEPACVNILGRFNAHEMADILSYFFPAAQELLPMTRSLLETIGFENRGIERAVDLLRNRLIDLGEVPPSMIASLEDSPAKEDAEGSSVPKLPTLEEISLTFGEYLPEEIEEIQRISEFDLAGEILKDTTPMLLDLLSQGAKLDNLGKAVEMLVQNFRDLTGSAQLGQSAAVLERVTAILENQDPAIDPFRSDLARLIEEAASGQVMHRTLRLAYVRRNEPQALEELKRYLSVLGQRGIMAMIEALGAEEDMSRRKYIIDILADLGRNHIQILGTYINDPRWYLVRNMVAIMARFHTPETLPYLKRTFHHLNPKVRAETIRALGLTGGYEAADILIQGLQSPDEQTRVPCIRWLGKLEETRAVGRLVNMLEEKEAGAENPRIKKEIVAALGEIRAPETYEVLKKYRSRHKFLNRAEWQEINAAAQEALDRLVERLPHLERKR
jgi:HEAT repeat protein